ncbi:unnamed protein product [Durusdinium trenchii]|uniref:C3H1-type domain-containing protein n=1 Tax=Durusdinium trenchii TaxID=1381693 RepID=A0ABP0MB55_9DINO
MSPGARADRADPLGADSDPSDGHKPPVPRARASWRPRLHVWPEAVQSEIPGFSRPGGIHLFSCAEMPQDFLAARGDRRVSPSVNQAKQAASEPGLLKADQSETEEKVELTTEVRERCMDLISKLPKDQSGCVTSLGSLFHKEGQCKPCAYWFKGQCKNGICCHNCHLVHQGQRPKRLRPGKTQKSGAGEMNLPEDEMPQSIWKKAMAERAIPSAPGPVGKQSIDVKVTTSALRQVCKEMGFQVAEAMVTTRLSL